MFQKQSKHKGQNSDAVVVEEKGYESTDVLIASEVNERGKWVLDYGCSFHMCPFINHFTKYFECDGGKVMMGNNVMCKVVGIGNINLKLHDGSTYELKQVKHVPDLKRNLISLGMIDQIGCIVKLQNRVMSAVKGS